MNRVTAELNNSIIIHIGIRIPYIEKGGSIGGFIGTGNNLESRGEFHQISAR